LPTFQACWTSEVNGFTVQKEETKRAASDAR
jgi:hypothetical protein